MVIADIYMGSHAAFRAPYKDAAHLEALAVYV